MLNKNTNQKVYITIAEGTLRERSNETVEGAVKRDYVLKNGDKGFKWELVYKDITGIIDSIRFRDTDYGKNIEIEIEGAVLSVGVKSNYGTDVMKKLPEMDLSQPVKLVPYAFTDDQGKARKGITVYQNDKKIPSYFHITDGKQYKSIHGFPVPGTPANGEKYTKNEWIIYYLAVEDFLIKYTENNIIPKINKEVKEIHGTESVLDNTQEVFNLPEEELNSPEIPF